MGYALDSNDLPLIAAKVKIQDYEALTNELGYFQIVIPLNSQIPTSIGYNAILEYAGEVSESTVYPQGDNKIVNVLYL